MTRTTLSSLTVLVASLSVTLGGCSDASAPPTMADGGGAGGAGGSLGGGAAGGGGAAPAADCGDGVVDGGEECDDGNQVESDGCNTDCRPSGKVLWASTISQADLGFEKAHAVTELADGRFAVVGLTPDAMVPDASDIAIALLDQAGNEVSKHSVDGPGVAESGGGHTDRAIAVAAVPDGGFVAVGYEFEDDLTVVGEAAEYPWIRRYNAVASPVWTKQAPTVPRGRAYAVAVNDNMIYVGGSQTDPAWLRGYNLNGAELWTLSPGASSAGCRHCKLIGLAAMPNGGVVASGLLGGGTNRDVWLATFAPDSQEGWSHLDPDKVPSGSARVGADTQGNTFLFVQMNGSEYVRKYDTDGKLAWHLDNPLGLDAYWSAVSAAPDGGFVLANIPWDGSRATVRATRFDSEGGKLWSTTWSRTDTSDERVFAVSVTPSGQVLLAGSTADAAATFRESDMFVALLTR